MRMTAVAACGAALVLMSAAAHAREPDDAAGPVAAEAAPAPAEGEGPPLEARRISLPASTPVRLRTVAELHSRNVREGETFSLTVARDVVLDGHVIVPQGTRAVGEVVWRTGRGVFGKSAKMQVALRYIELAGRRIPLWGNHHQEGRGNASATVGAVVAAGVVGGLLVTGRSAVIPAGQELEAVIVDAIPVVIPASGPAAVAESYRPSPILTTGRTQLVRRRPEPDER